MKQLIVMLVVVLFASTAQSETRREEVARGCDFLADAAEAAQKSNQYGYSLEVGISTINKIYPEGRTRKALIAVMYNAYDTVVLRTKADKDRFIAEYKNEIRANCFDVNGIRLEWTPKD